jgi:hypothetical protein
MIRGDFVEVPTSGVAPFKEIEFIVPSSSDPCSRRILFAPVFYYTLDVLYASETLEARQIQRYATFCKSAQVEMSIDESGKDSSASAIDELSVLGSEFLVVVPLPDGSNGPLEYGHPFRQRT